VANDAAVGYKKKKREMLSAQIDSWGREVEENRKSWRPVLSSSSSSMWSWLRSAVPLLLIATFALAAIFFIYVDLLRGTYRSLKYL